MSSGISKPSSRCALRVRLQTSFFLMSNRKATEAAWTRARAVFRDEMIVVPDEQIGF